MKHRQTLFPCGFREEDLMAVALDEAETMLQQAVQSHILQCQTCHDVFGTYRRLHQVLTHLQATSPDDAAIRQARAKLAQVLNPEAMQSLQYRQVASALGELTVAKSARGVSLLTWRDTAVTWPSSLDPQETLQTNGDDLHQLITELQAYFAGSRTRFTWSIDDMLVRSAFQRDVLRVTADIPYGAVMSYQGIASAIGRPKAVRAVAQALRRNPIAIVIPCHRVVGRTGHLTGYAGGLERKRALLAHEGLPLVTRSGGVFIDKARTVVGWRTERAYCKPHCPSLALITHGNMLLVSLEAIKAQGDFIPCDVCHPEVVSA
jgi:methylated-DNA-[protein]-cysteine S-methyltransferase